MAVTEFGGFRFKLSEGERASILLARGESPIAEAVLTGQNKISRDGKRIPTAEGSALLYKGHRFCGDFLEVVQESEILRSVVTFEKFPDTNAIRVFQSIENRTQEEVRVSQVSSFVLYGMDGNSIHDLKRTHLYRFFNSWHCECQPQRYSLFDAGLYSGGHASFRRVYGSNKGGWSTKEELPQAIIEHAEDGSYTMFEIESPNSWYWEIGECGQGVYLYTGGADAWDHEWEVRLLPGEKYSTPATAICTGMTLNDTVAEMTKYRRHLLNVCPVDKNLPVVFNEYMHLSWDSPTEERTHRMAPVVADLGADIYAIDCGWHNEEDGEVIYPYVGQWKESKKRYPHGIARTIDYIHSLGMKAGLWMEPEVVGQLCEEMISIYPADAWMCRDGVPVVVGGRRFLDYRCKAVVEYMDAAVDRIVTEYGADYLKFDYNSADFDQEAYAIGIEPNSFPVESEMQWNPVYHAAVKDFGGTMIDTDLSGQDAIKVDTDATINAYKKIYTDLFASRFSYGPQDGTTSTAFLSSKAAMWFNVRPKLPTIRNRNINVDFLPMPFDVIGVGNSGYAITSVAKDRLSTEGGNTKNNEDLAWEVIKWLITEPGQQALGRSGAGIPVLKSLKSSGDWIDENDPSLNHTAFTAYEERDMGLNIFNIYKPQNHKVMFDTMTLIITAAISPNSWEKQGEEYVMSSRFVNDLNTYKQEMLAKAE